MHDTLLMVFTGVVALAVVIQTVLFFGMYKAIRQMAALLDSMGKDLIENFTAVTAKVDEGLSTVKEFVDGLKPIREKLANTTDIVHERVLELDAFLSEATSTARLEILKIQDVVQAASQKAEETVEFMRTSLLAPFNEISAVSRGIRVAMDVLFRRRRAPGSALDDEMFI
jgi:methyl-accepting chemotaxis protein